MNYIKKNQKSFYVIKFEKYKKRRLLARVPDCWRLSIFHDMNMLLLNQHVELCVPFNVDFTFAIFGALTSWLRASQPKNRISYNSQKLKEFSLNIIQEFWRDCWKCFWLLWFAFFCWSQSVNHSRLWWLRLGYCFLKGSFISDVNDELS